MRPSQIGPGTEPVPQATQLVALPFLSALDGFLRGPSPKLRLRLTIHRTVNRAGRIYLQQVCPYVGPVDSEDRLKQGRFFSVTEGIIGAAFGQKHVFRTRRYETRESFLKALKKDMIKTGDDRDPNKLPLSWLAVPFVGRPRNPVLVLFADVYELNYFADNKRIRTIVDMCWGFCRLIDTLEENPFRNLRNFPFQAGVALKGNRTVYPTIQEGLPTLATPRFKKLVSYNYDASTR